jgi:hypothetical protein
MNKAVASIAIVLFFLLQTLAPLRYYLSAREIPDQLDERFAWRMFSVTSRNFGCEVEFRNAQGKIELGKHYQQAWLDLAHLCRKQVLQALGEDLCLRSKSVSATIDVIDKRNKTSLARSTMQFC